MQNNNKLKKFFISLISLVVSFFLTLSFYFLLTQNKDVSVAISESMYPNFPVNYYFVKENLDPEDSIVLGRAYSFVPTVEIGDYGRRHYLKRVIAGEGDTIEFRPYADRTGYSILINGEPIQQEALSLDDISEYQKHIIESVYGHLDFDFYLETVNGHSYVVMYTHLNKKSENVINNYLLRPLSITLQEDEYFFLGDNRNESLDSRYMGVIHRENIKTYISGDFIISKDYFRDDQQRFLNSRIEEFR